jgi:hypothetical protein
MTTHTQSVPDACCSCGGERRGEKSGMGWKRFIPFQLFMLPSKEAGPALMFICQNAKLLPDFLIIFTKNVDNDAIFMYVSTISCEYNDFSCREA